MKITHRMELPISHGMTMFTLRKLLDGEDIPNEAKIRVTGPYNDPRPGDSLPAKIEFEWETEVAE